MPKTKEELARDARVKAVEDAIAEAKRVRDEQELSGIVETKGARLDRLEQEAKNLKEAGELRGDDEVERAEDVLVKDVAKAAAEAQRTEEAKELKIHTDARDARVLAVKDAIAAAKLVRDQQETEGLVESQGAKLDRLVKEAKDLADAEVLNVIEPIGIDVNDAEVMRLADKVNDIVKFLNRTNRFLPGLVDDGDLEEVELEDLSKTELKELALERGLTLEGGELKEELVNLLRDNEDNQ